MADQINWEGGYHQQSKDTARANEILRRPEVKSMFPSDVTILWDRKGIETTDKRNEIVGIYFIKKWFFLRDAVIFSIYYGCYERIC